MVHLAGGKQPQTGYLQPIPVLELISIRHDAEFPKTLGLFWSFPVSIGSRREQFTAILYSHRQGQTGKPSMKRQKHRMKNRGKSASAPAGNSAFHLLHSTFKKRY